MAYNVTGPQTSAFPDLLRFKISAVVQLRAFNLEDQAFDLHLRLVTLVWKKWVNALKKVVRIVPALRFSPTREMLTGDMDVKFH